MLVFYPYEIGESYFNDNKPSRHAGCFVLLGRCEICVDCCE